MLLFFTLICFGSWRQERARNFKSSSAELSSECSGTEQSWAMTILSTLLSLKISTSNLTFVSKQVKLWIVDINLSIRNLVNQRKTKNINMHLATYVGIGEFRDYYWSWFCVPTIKGRLDLWTYFYFWNLYPSFGPWPTQRCYGKHINFDL